jgi:PKD repeat protein
VFFSAQNSTDPDGTVASCVWDFGDCVNTTGTQVSHAYQDTGTFKVNLTVTDDFGAKNSNSMEVTVILRNFTVGWSLVPGSVPAISDHSQENSTVNKTVSLAFPNMTVVSFRMTWKDDIPHWLLGGYNDDFGLTVVDPQNNTQSLSDMGGNITLNFTLAESPSSFSLSARTEADAREQVGGKYSKQVGVGDWLVSVILGEAGGAQEVTGTDIDTGNNWKLDVTYYQYEMSVTES